MERQNGSISLLVLILPALVGLGSLVFINNLHHAQWNVHAETLTPTPTPTVTPTPTPSVTPTPTPTPSVTPTVTPTPTPTVSTTPTVTPTVTPTPTKIQEHDKDDEDEHDKDDGNVEHQGQHKDHNKTEVHHTHGQSGQHEE